MNTKRIGIWMLLLSGFTSSLFGDSIFSFSGAFTGDDSEAEFTFSITGPETVTLQTTSYASGGFAPTLSLFGTLDQSDPLLLGQDSGGVAGGAGNPGCGTRAVNPNTGLCLDAELQVGPLEPDTYLVVLTEDPNIPLGPNLSDGFLYPPGSGNFTANGVLPGPFVDPLGDQMTGDYGLSISSVDSASQVSASPEPYTSVELTTGLVLMAIGLRRGKRESKTQSIGKKETIQ